MTRLPALTSSFAPLSSFQTFQPLAPDPVLDEAGLLRRIGAGTASGLSSAGNLLDLPGSVIRDIVSTVAQGKFVNPVDQLLSPFSPENRTTGRELITQLGLANKNKETGISGWADDPMEAIRDIGGFAAEVALDPFFAAPKTAAKGLKALAVNPATRKTGRALAGTRIGGQAIDVGSAAGRQLGALFDYSVKGATSTAGRMLGRSATGAERAAKVGAYEQMAPLLKEFHGFTRGMDTNATIDAGRSLRRAVEGIEPLPKEMSHLQGAVDEYRKIAGDLPAREISEGLKSRVLDDTYADYATRRRFFFPGDKSKGRDFPARILSGRHALQNGRKNILTDVQGGTDFINKLSLDKRISGIAHRTQPSKMTGQAGRKFWDQQQKLLEKVMPELGYRNFWMSGEQSRALAKWLANLDPRHVSEKIPVFPHNPLAELTRRVELGERAMGMARSIRETLGQEGNLRLAGDDLAGDVRLRDVLDSAGLDADTTGSLLGVDAAKAFVPKELADDIGRVAKTFQQPEEVSGVLKLVDDLTRVWKAGQTTVFPAFHSRNFGSGQVMNAMMGMFSPKTVRAIDKLVRQGKTIDNVDWSKLGKEFEGLSDEAATDLFARQAFADQVAPRGQGLGLEDVAGTTLADDLAADIPGATQMRFRDIGKAYVPTRLEQLNPLNIAGVARQTDVFAPVAGGRIAGHYVESLNRLSPYLDLRLKGFSRADAAAKVRSAQVDYDALSTFEKSVMRRVMPFYSFTKGMAKHVAGELMQHPGGRLGQTIRAQRTASETDQPLPEYVAQTGGIPLSETEDGTQRFITGLGLMHEDPLSFLGEGVRGVGLEAMSRLNPLAKLGAEYITGESFFQRGPMGGRDIRDMDPTLGRLLTNIGVQSELPSGGARPVISQGFEHFLANSPLSRALTTARTLTDPRKGAGATALNTLTGVRVSDVSPAAQDRAISDVASARAREALGGRLFERVTIPRAEIEQNLLGNPELADLQETYNQIQGNLARRRRERSQSRTITAQEGIEAAQLRRQVEEAKREQAVRLQLQQAVGP